VTPKYTTSNDLDGLFGVKFCFRAGLAGWDRATRLRKVIAWKLIKTSRHTTSWRVGLTLTLSRLWRASAGVLRTPGVRRTPHPLGPADLCRMPRPAVVGRPQSAFKDRPIDRHILSAAQISGMDSSFWRYKVCADIRSGSLWKGNVTGQWGRALTVPVVYVHFRSDIGL